MGEASGTVCRPPSAGRYEGKRPYPIGGQAIRVDAAVMRMLFLLLLAVLFLSPPSVARAGSEHCRNLNFGGAAGEASQDIVVLRLVDETGATILDESCPVQVLPSETAKDFAERIPAWWACDPDSEEPCPTSGCPDSSYVDAVYTKSNGQLKLPKKFCGDLGAGDQRSCKIKFIYKEKKKTGEVKKGPTLKICCKAGDDCKGPKWGKDSSQRTPVNVQSQNSGVGASFLPPSGSLPVGVGEDVDVVVDPISLEQLPFPAVRDCRQALARAIRKLSSSVLNTLVDCHARVMAGDLVADCNSVGPLSDAGGNVAAAILGVDFAISRDCAAFGSPAKFAYKSCPAPCGHVALDSPVCVQGGNLGVSCSRHSDCNSVADAGSGVCANTCSAGSVGQACRKSADCDTAPGAGDGACGNWDAVDDCLGCLAGAIVGDALAQVYGNPGPGLGPAEQACQNAMGDNFAKIVSFLVADAAKCLKLRDAGKVALPNDPAQPGVKATCKNADLKGKRDALLGKLPDILRKSCMTAAVDQLEVCGGLPPDECVGTLALATAEQLIELMAPESR
ncbi:MAG: hypothetical protein ACE5E4_06910 [Candidatus Binatia bacterium]